MAKRRAGRKPSQRTTDPRDRGSAPVTRKQIAVSRKERKQLRLIWIGVIAVSVLVVGVLAYALVREFVIEPSAPVAVVNGAKVSTKDYQALVAYSRHMLYREQSFQRLQFSDNEELLSYIDELYQARIQAVPEQSLEQLIEDILIAEVAQELGFSVSDSEVEQQIQVWLGYTEGIPTPLPDPSEPATATLALPTSITQDELQTRFQEEMEFVASAGVSERQYRDIVKRQLLRQQVAEHFASLVPETGLVAQVQIVQLDTGDDAEAAKARLDAGEDFGAVAEELSTDATTKDAGGDLGWIALGQMTTRYGQEFERVAFSTQVDTISEPVLSNDKHYIIRVLDRDPDGPLPEDVLLSRQNSALAGWLSDQLASDEIQIERRLTPDKIPPDTLGQ
jgi:parvulin-like peptidyl-prolyl isomerase